MASETLTRTRPEPEPEREPAARAGRGLKTVRDMMLSMAVICAAVFGLFLLVPQDASEDDVRPVEYDVASATAARVAPYEVLVPQGLPDGWRATSVRYEPQGEFGPVWRLGFLDPEDRYAALAQSGGGDRGFIASITQQAEATGRTARVGGEVWARYEGPRYDALVRQEAGATTVVFGSAPFDVLSRFAEALRVRDATP